MIKVFIPPLLRDAAGGLEQVEIDAATVRQAVAALEARFPGMRERLCVGEMLRPGLSVAVNGTVSSLGLLQKVPDGSEVHFLPAVGGG
ncbi:MAG: MoaD/ThiS family protein [Deltaproteobacteria bacterium]